MAQLVQVPKQAEEVRGLFKANTERLLRSAPKGVDPTRLLTIAFNSIVYDSKLVQCTRESLFGGVMEALKMGLSIGGPMQEAWLLPFKNKRGELEATMIVGYQGYRVLVDRAKSVIALHPRAVYTHDDFDVEFGTNTRIHHKPFWMIGHTEPGPLIAVYAVANLRGGGVQIEVMPRAEVEQHRARSRAKDSGPWLTDFDAMALKTVIRKICKYLPKASEAGLALARALQIDDQADRGEDQVFDIEGLTLDTGAIQVGTGARQIGGTAVDALKQTLRERQAGERQAEPQPVATRLDTGQPLSEEEVLKRLDAEMAAKEAELAAERAAIVADGSRLDGSTPVEQTQRVELPARPRQRSKLETDLFDKPFE